MKRLITGLVLALLGAVIIFKEAGLKRPAALVREGCLSCHSSVTDPDPSHPIKAFGCFRCHLGNPYSYDKERAHYGMAQNPGDLRVVEHTCGTEACHPQIISRVKKGLMATNRSILETIQANWPSRASISYGTPAARVADLLSDKPPSNLALDHYRKMCAGCHLWKPRKDYDGEAGLRGGGCSDCHVTQQELSSKDGFNTFRHPEITTRIPSENCIKCHNRSARIGLSYTGRWESEGYGTPYEGAELSSRKLSGNRFYLDLPSDVHFSKASMECVDCHTSVGLMGDGKEYNSISAQVDITCESCHMPMLSRLEEDENLGRRLLRLNRRIPDPAGGKIAFTVKGTPVYNLQEKGGKLIFFRKSDGLPVEVPRGSAEKPHHVMEGHERLSCQSCHSLWIPQCYGCHVSYDESAKQTDWLTGEKTRGRWSEARSLMRFSRPSLGMRASAKVYPVAPCQVFFKSESFSLLTLSAFDPHTTSAKSRQCKDCHGDPKTIGLGEGILTRKEDEWSFRSSFSFNTEETRPDFLFDSFVTLDGKALHGNARDGTRPFNDTELNRILDVNPCLGCHKSYRDPIYKDFSASVRRFREGGDLPCLQ